MRPTTLAKIFMMVALFVTSVTVTSIVVPTKSKSSTVMIQKEQDQEKPPADVPVDAKVLVERLAQIKGVKPEFVENTTMGLVFAQGGPSCVHVKADAAILDSRPGMAFMWGIRLVDPIDRKTVLYEYLYTDQVAPLEPGVVQRPTFEDIVEVAVEPGEYLFETFVYRVPGGDPEELLKSRHSELWRSSSVAKLVTIH